MRIKSVSDWSRIDQLNLYRNLEKLSIDKPIYYFPNFCNLPLIKTLNLVLSGNPDPVMLKTIPASVKELSIEFDLYDEDQHMPHFNLAGLPKTVKKLTLSYSGDEEIYVDLGFAKHLEILHIKNESIAIGIDSKTRLQELYIDNISEVDWFMINMLKKLRIQTLMLKYYSGIKKIPKTVEELYILNGMADASDAPHVKHFLSMPKIKTKPKKHYYSGDSSSEEDL